MKKYLVLSALTLGAIALPLAAGYADDHKDGHDGKKGHRYEKMFEKQDIDGNGEVSKAEFIKGAEDRFAKMDLNGDGVVTKEEAKENMEKMRKKWKEHKGKKGEHDDTPPPAPAE